jgi:hypothetical protein
VYEEDENFVLSVLYPKIDPSVDFNPVLLLIIGVLSSVIVGKIQL